MIRAITTSQRSAIAAVRSTSGTIELRQRSSSADAIKNRPLVRSFNTYAQQFPYYEDPIGRYQADPFPRHYADPIAHQVNPSFSQFHPGVNGRDSRFGYQLRGEYSPYPVGVSWKSYGPNCYCRCCGRPFWNYQRYPPVSYNVGQYGGGVVQGNGPVDWGIRYDRGGGYQMRSDYINPYAGGGARGHENRNTPYAHNLGYNSRSSDGNVVQNGKNVADSYYERRGVPQVNGFKEQKIAHDGYRRPQDGYSWKNDHFIENGGPDGCGRGVWSQSGGNYDHSGSEHSDHSYHNQLHQGNGYIDQKNGSIGNQTRLRYNGEGVGGQPPNSTVSGQPMNSNGASGEFEHSRQSPRLSDVLRNDNNHGSHECTQNVSMQSSREYNQAEACGSYGHENLIRPSNENMNGFQQNSNTRHGQNLNVNPNGGQYQKRFNASTIGEAGRMFQENNAVRQDSVNIGYEQIRNGSKLRNLYDPLPEFATKEQPLSPNRTSAQNNQMPNINDSWNDGGRLPHGSMDAAGRCQGIIDVLKTEDKYGPKGPDSRFVTQSRNKWAVNSVAGSSESGKVLQGPKVEKMSSFNGERL